MGTKSTIALTAGLALVAASIGFLALATARQGAALAQLEARLAATAAAEAAAARADLAASASATPRIIYIDGAIQRPGVYEVPQDGGLTAGRLLAAAGAEPVDLRVYLIPAADSAKRLAAWREQGGSVDTRDGAPCLVIDRMAKDGIVGYDPLLSAGDKLWIARR